jgi:hypothetical protein
MTKDEALDLALEALTPFSTPNWAGTGVDKANEAIAAIKQARSAPVQEPVAKDNSNYRLDPPGLDPAGGTQVSKVWWDGEKLMAKPIPLEDIYQPAPVQEPDYWLGYGLQAHTEKPFEGATPLYTTPPAAQRQCEDDK